ncbi:MAG: hypothetical protein R3F11_04375 [Verrucomicrobiales bacterium]
MIYDDDVTQSAIRFLTRCQKVLPDADPSVKEAAVYGLAAVLGTQYPNGAWSANFDRFPANGSPDPAGCPVKLGALSRRVVEDVDEGLSRLLHDQRRPPRPADRNPPARMADARRRPLSGRRKTYR